MALKKGDQAPKFELPQEPGKTVNVGEHIGRDKVVLLFFPLSFSSVCTSEMCAMRDTWSEWEGLDAKVFGITVDSPFITKKFREELHIPFPILSDFNREVAPKYGALHEDLMGLKGVTKRAAFVIDEQGKIAYAWVSDDPKNLPPFEEVKSALREPAGVR